MAFGDVQTAARFRDWARRIIVTEINKLMPADKFGVASATDTTNRLVDVTFSNETDAHTYNYYGANPTDGDTVRVTGRTGSRYVLN